MAAVGNPEGAGMENRESNFYGVFMQRLSANGQQDMSATTSVKVAAAASSASDKGQEQTVGVQETVDPDDATLFSRDTLAEIFALEMRTCRELIEVEPSCRWPRLQLLHMIEKLQQASLPLPEGAAGGNERGRLLGELLELDPTHAGYYRDCLRKLEP